MSEGNTLSSVSAGERSLSGPEAKYGTRADSLASESESFGVCGARILPRWVTLAVCPLGRRCRGTVWSSCLSNGRADQSDRSTPSGQAVRRKRSPEIVTGVPHFALWPVFIEIRTTSLTHAGCN